MKGLIEHVRLFAIFLPLFRRKLGLWRPPLRVEQLCEVNESETGASTSSASKVEDDGHLHGGKKGIARARSSVVHEVGLVNTTIGGLSSRFADDPRPELGITMIVKGWGNYTSQPYPSL